MTSLKDTQVTYDDTDNLLLASLELVQDWLVESGKTLEQLEIMPITTGKTIKPDFNEVRK